MTRLTSNYGKGIKFVSFYAISKVLQTQFLAINKDTYDISSASSSTHSKKSYNQEQHNQSESLNTQIVCVLNISYIAQVSDVYADFKVNTFGSN